MEKTRQFDAIVIGSGMGGLAAASLLAQMKRYRVLVLERHFKLGGFIQSFQRPGGYHWDVGLHYVGELESRSPYRQAMDYITAGRLKWVKMKDPFDVFLYPDLRFEVSSDRADYLRKLQDLFPQESGPLQDYFLDIIRVREILIGRWLPSAQMLKREEAYRQNYDLIRQTLQTYLDSHFRDSRLKGLLASQWGNYGLPPKLASFGTHAATVRHYLDGGYYPSGSSSALVDVLAEIVREAGGELKTRHRVVRILVEDRKARGVEVETLGGRVRFDAPEIYSDAGAEATYNGLLSEETHAPEILKELSNSPVHGVVVLYLGLKSTCGSLGVHGQNFWIYEHYDHDAMWENRNSLAGGKASYCFLSFPGIKDPGAKAPTAEIIADLDYDVFQTWRDKEWMRRGRDYSALKTKITETLLNFVESRLPGFRKEVAYAELSTPLTVKHFTGYRGGNIYGFPGVSSRYEMECFKPNTPIEGLKLVGVDAGSSGISGAMFGGLLGVAAQHGNAIFHGLAKGN